MGLPKTILILQYLISAHALRQLRVASLLKCATHGKIIQENMLMSPSSDRSTRQHKRNYPNHYRHKMCIIGNYAINHLEHLTKKVHASRSILLPRASVQPSSNHTKGKMHMHRTTTRLLHRNEVQFKHYIFKRKTKAPYRPTLV